MTVMEALSVKFLLPSINTNLPTRRDLINSKFSDGGVLGLSLNHKKIRSGIGQSRITTWSKKSLYQDFHAFAEPTRLLPVTNAKFCTEQRLEELISFRSWDESCFYILQLRTSSEFGSGIGDANAAILVCLIDACGNSVMQRLSAALTEDAEIGNGSSYYEQVHFQRGSVDTITFYGPNMGKLEALWVGLECGSWRLGDLRLTVISKNQSSSLAENVGDIQFNGLQYDFEVNDILLGEGGGTSIAELTPQLVTEFPINNSTGLTYITDSLPSLFSQGISNAQGMKEYADLKLSLLIYDILLVSAGATILSFSTSEKSTLAFLVGGISGFLYLLSLQKSVDDLSSSTLPSINGKMENTVGALRGFKGPLSKLVLLLATFAAVFKYGMGDSSVDLTPQQLLLATVGFFTCKIAVLFAAFKPWEINVE